jgi:biopolymer transport protein ExbB/TolQ
LNCRALRASLARRVMPNVFSGIRQSSSEGSTEPFAGLFGPVRSVYQALPATATSGQTSTDQVAGPVDESLIMTGFGLFVPIPPCRERIGYGRTRPPDEAEPFRA